MKPLTVEQKQRFEKLQKAFELHNENPEKYPALPADERSELARLGGVAVANKVDQMFKDYSDRGLFE